MTMRNIRQNLVFAFAYNAIGIPVAAGVLYPAFGILLSPVVAALAMSLSSVSVIANALRLRAAQLVTRGNRRIIQRPFRRTIMPSASARALRPSPIAFLMPLLCLFLVGCGYNNIPTYEEQAKAKWSDVLNQYQRRSDLIPNLVETVKGFAKQESSVLEAVTAARASATSVKVDASTITDPATFKKFQDAQAQLSGSLGRLLAISENYPTLKSDQNFLALQSQLEGHGKPDRRCPARLYRSGSSL